MTRPKGQTSARPCCSYSGKGQKCGSLWVCVLWAGLKCESREPSPDSCHVCGERGGLKVSNLSQRLWFFFSNFCPVSSPAQALSVATVRDSENQKFRNWTRCRHPIRLQSQHILGSSPMCLLSVIHGADQLWGLSDSELNCHTFFGVSSEL